MPWQLPFPRSGCPTFDKHFRGYSPALAITPYLLNPLKPPSDMAPPKKYYELHISHDGLNKYRHIKGTDPNVVERTALAQQRTWDEMWERKVAAEKAAQEKKRAAAEKEANRKLAEERTEEAKEVLDNLKTTLHSTLHVNDTINWDSLLNLKQYPVPHPPDPVWTEFPHQPNQEDRQYTPRQNLLDRLFPGYWRKRQKDAFARYHIANRSWEEDVARIDSENKAKAASWQTHFNSWEADRDKYERDREETNRSIQERKEKYLQKDPNVVTDYVDMVFARSVYPDWYSREWNIDFIGSTSTIAIDYGLPAPESVPTLKEVKFIASRDEFKDTFLSKTETLKMYDDLLYQITLRSIHEVFESDQVGAIDSVVFNGWVHSIDKATGKPITVCVLSVQSSKDEFLEIDLENVEPKTCFKALKGVGSSKLHGMMAIAPILALRKEDDRFVSSYSVVGEIDSSCNLAAMDWEDFEHLIREVFEKEFSSSGGEVKVTQASRDGGVDAIAFDPDPIRGGKIVIQAKRYTNTVGVAAVRDLYGTVMNEGATKGILVTTADYGPDAYGFAKEKPLTLLNGANLLHLLEKHGHKATIDIREAKRLLAERGDL